MVRRVTTWLVEEGVVGVNITVHIYYEGSNGSARKFAEEMESSGTADAVRQEAGISSMSTFSRSRILKPFS